jgi:hypothetical protein
LCHPEWRLPESRDPESFWVSKSPTSLGAREAELLFTWPTPWFEVWKFDTEKDPGSLGYARDDTKMIRQRMQEDTS